MQIERPKTRFLQLIAPFIAASLFPHVGLSLMETILDIIL
jgi:hypothetical protein